MTKYSLIPDSSFYICFLDDIKEPKYITRLLKCDKFVCYTGPIIKKEIEKSLNYFHIENTINRDVFIFEYYNYGEILRPFFSINEIKKGENEVIVISYILYSQNRTFITILDDGDPRKFLKQNFPEIYNSVEGTITFTANCCIKNNIFSQEETLNILELIRKSKFRVDNKIVDEAIVKVRCYKNV